MSSELLHAFQFTGRALAEAGLVHGSSGNLSCRLSSSFLITTHNSNLGSLAAKDIVQSGVYTGDSGAPGASFELPVHRAIYQATGARAVVHAHPACAVALSVAEKSPNLARAPVIGEAKSQIIPGVLAGQIAGLLRVCPLIMVRSHGSFAVGKTLAEALNLTLAFEEKCRKLCRERGIKLQSPQNNTGE